MASYYDYSNNKQSNEGNFGGFYDGSGFSQQQQQPQQQQQQQQPGLGSFGSYGGDQWQQPTAGPMHPGYGVQQQSQQQQQNFWNPATMVSMAAAAGSMNNEAMLGIASTAAGSFLQSGTARMVPGLESSMLTLRDYFAVDNNYVKTKMLKILFPFRSKHWKRTVRFRMFRSSVLVISSSCHLIVFTYISKRIHHKMITHFPWLTKTPQICIYLPCP